MSNYQWALIVDDQEDQIELVTEYLELLEIESAGTTRFAHFKQLCNEKFPDLVVLDISMPDHDAFDYINWIAEQNSTTTLILMSGLGDACMNVAAAIAAEHEIPVLELLHKPFTYQALEDCLRPNLNS